MKRGDAARIEPDTSTLSVPVRGSDPRPGTNPSWRAVNITPAERLGRIVSGLAAIVAGVVLLVGATSVLAVLLEVLLVLAGLDLLVTGALGLPALLEAPPPSAVGASHPVTSAAPGPSPPTGGSGPSSVGHADHSSARLARRWFWLLTTIPVLASGALYRALQTEPSAGAGPTVLLSGTVVAAATLQAARILLALRGSGAGAESVLTPCRVADRT